MSRREVVEVAQYLDELAHDGGSILFPAFLHRFLFVAGGRDEEEGGLVPQLLDETYTALDQSDDAGHGSGVGFDAFLFEDGHEEGRELFVALLLDVFVVEPFAFFVVEFGAALAALLEREELDELVHRQDFLVVAGVPAQQGEEVYDSFGQVSGLAVARRNLARLGIVPLEREYGESQAVAVAFAQFALTVGFQQQRQVGKAGHGIFPAEGAVEQYMQRGRGQPLFAADDVRDEHQVVVDDVGQVVGGQVVGRLVEHLVVENRRVDGHLAADEVIDYHVFARFNLEPHHVLGAVGNEPVDLFFAHRERVAHLHAGRGVVLEVGYFVTFGIELGRSVESDVGFAGFEQLVYVFAIDLFAFRLAIRAVVAAVAHPFVEVDAQPFEGFDDVGLGSRYEPLGVGIFDAENHVAVVLLGKQIVIESGTDSANVQGARGTWCETHPYFSFGHIHIVEKRDKIKHFF